MDLVRRIDCPRDREDDTISAGERPPRREWLVTNGLGGYASGTLLGLATRRYHGVFVPNLPAPRGRTGAATSLPSLNLFSISIRRFETASESSVVRAGASPSQNGIPGG